MTSCPLSSNVAGLTPPQHIDQIFQVINKSRDLVNAATRADLERGQLTYPQIDTPPVVAVQSAEKTEAGNTELDLGNASGALEEYRRALAAFEAMARADPKSTDPILGIAFSHHNSAEALEKLGRRAEALEEFRRARPAYESVMATSPSGAWAAGMLGSLYVRTADLESSDDHGSACGLYGKAVRVFESVPGSDLSPESQVLLTRARERLAACGSRP